VEEVEHDSDDSGSSEEGEGSSRAGSVNADGQSIPSENTGWYSGRYVDSKSYHFALDLGAPANSLLCHLDFARLMLLKLTVLSTGNTPSMSGSLVTLNLRAISRQRN
jgi:hypothetical protein